MEHNRTRINVTNETADQNIDRSREISRKRRNVMPIQEKVKRKMETQTPLIFLNK